MVHENDQKVGGNINKFRKTFLKLLFSTFYFILAMHGHFFVHYQGVLYLIQESKHPSLITTESQCFLPGVSEVGPVGHHALRHQGLRRRGLEVEGGYFWCKRKAENQRKDAPARLSL